MKNKYTPIDCRIYERYELAIMHRQRLMLRWQDGDGITHLETMTPRDLKTEAGEEFLLAETSKGELRRLRLDKILRAETLNAR
ncbi:MAG: transcriptional antiterminator, Rof [Gammaproteobacteria bacterium]|nr:transcriptional antiterminator, Rof [Gammaproteobacteria bacterium]